MTAPSSPHRLPAADEMVERLLELPEARGLAIDALLRLAAIEWDEDVATACVECVATPRMLLNPGFVARHCDTPRKLGFLILHELAHVSLGHSRLAPRCTPVENVVFDAFINASLLQGLDYGGKSAVGWDALVVATYAADESPAFLLRPPPGWPHEPDWDASAAATPALRDIHRRLYGRRPVGLVRQWEGVTYGEIVRALLEAHGTMDNNLSGGEAGSGPLLLGAHGVTDRERAANAGDRDRAALEALGDLMSRLPHDPVHSHGSGSNPFSLRIARVAPDAELVAALQKLFRSALCGVEARTRLREGTRARLSVDPSGDRRAAVRRHVARLLGAPKPVLYADSTPAPRPVPDGRTAIYLDVSGSMRNVLEPMHAALVALRRLLAPKVLVFSTDVVELARAGFLQGKVVTTGGTSVEPVLIHLAREARAGRVRRAVLLTDGIFCAPSTEAIDAVVATGAELHLGVTTQETHASARWVTTSTRLPRLPFSY